MDTKNALIQEKGTKIEGTGDYSIEGNDEALAEVKAMADEEMDFSYPVKVTLNLDPNSPWISASVLKTFFDVLGNDGFEIVAPASSTVATAMPMQAGGNCASGQCNAPAQAAGMKQDGTYTGDKAYKKTPAQK
ncbi:hypothetical protein KAU11_11755 [Candidatus Babeliales bacterium]|nr:hypothetical protein [Candidatus Babeliales bacterium]